MKRTNTRDDHPRIAEIYNRYLGHLLQGERQACLEIINELIENQVPLKSIYLQVFERSMYQVGTLWETNKISVATEHIATSVTESAMGLLFPIIFNAEHCGRKAIVSCVATEYHQIGGRMVADIFELHGWDSYFLGGNVPVTDLLRMVEDKQPDVIGLSLTLYSHLPDLLRHIHSIHNAFPDIKMLVGGQAFHWGGRDSVMNLPQTQLLDSSPLEELENFIISHT